MDKQITPEEFIKAHPEMIDRLKEIVAECSEQVGVGVEDISILNPARIDDFEAPAVKFNWRASIESVRFNEELSKIIKGNLIGGHLGFPMEVSIEEMYLAFRNQVLWILITETVPERNFIYQGIEVSRYSQNSILMGAFLRDCIKVMADSLHKANRVDQIHSVAKTMRIVTDNLTHQAKNYMQEVRNKMAQELTGTLELDKDDV